MSQLARDKDRVHVGAHVDRAQRDELVQLVQLARERDRSVSSGLRRAIAHELQRSSGGDSSSHPPRAGLSNSEGPATGGEE